VINKDIEKDNKKPKPKNLKGITQYVITPKEIKMRENIKSNFNKYFFIIIVLLLIKLREKLISLKM
jgi:hypothetical protein